MAWGSQGAVFLGEDLMHTRDYSDETARVIDEEVERILREQEDRARKVLTGVPPRARRGRATRCSSARRSTAPRSRRLVDEAMGHKAGGPRLVTRADGSETPVPPAAEGESLSDVDDGVGGMAAELDGLDSHDPPPTDAPPPAPPEPTPAG